MGELVVHQTESNTRVEPWMCMASTQLGLGRANVSSYNSHHEEMQQEVWKKMPEELLEKVLAHLPIGTLFRLQSVCKRWHSLISSHSFLQAYSEMSSKQLWFYLCRIGKRSGIYDPVLHNWHWTQHPLVKYGKLLMPVASTGGLVCLFDLSCRALYVCDPLGKLCHLLPPRHFMSAAYEAVGMVMNKEAKGYKLLLVHVIGDCELYDSLTNTWNRISPLLPDGILQLKTGLFSKTITMDGCLYMLRRHPDSLVSFNVEKGSWHELPAPFPSYSRHLALLQCNGRILLAGMLGQGNSSYVCVWELQKMTFLWMEVDRMPNEICPGFISQGLCLRCLGNRDRALLCLRYKEWEGLVDTLAEAVVMYDICKKKWQWVGISTPPPMCDKHISISGISFEPQFDASLMSQYIRGSSGL